MLNVLGKYILDSGIDTLFVEAGIYGHTVLGHIIEGKHMKRGIKVSFTMHLALSSIHLKETFIWSNTERIHSNLHKLLTIMKTFSVGFELSEDVSKLVSKTILPPLASKELLRHEMIGNELYHDFISNRLNDELSIWSPIKICNWKTFKVLKETSKLKIGDRIKKKRSIS